MQKLFEHRSRKKSESSRTYDDVVDYVIRESEYDPYMVIRVRGFLEYF